MDRLSNTVRPYAWGSTTLIPTLLGVAPTGEPQAEMWMGAHPGAPSRITRTGAADATAAAPAEQALTDVIAADPTGELGQAAVEKFGPRLPFLLKLLAAGAPLSLQVHPDLAQAQQGYADEEARSVPIDAPHRVYKDANHKPELICALTPFDGLCGFQPARRGGRGDGGAGRRLPQAVRRSAPRPPRRGRPARGPHGDPHRGPGTDGGHGDGRGCRRRTDRRQLRPVRTCRPPLPGRQPASSRPCC